MKYKKKVTLITGANSKIGRAIAEKFAQENHDLVLIFRKKSEIKKLQLFEKKYHIKVKVYVGDLRNDKFLFKLKKEIRWVDNLVNNAAMRNTKFFLKVTNKDINDLIKVNLESIYKLSQIFAEKMIRNKIKGTIIGISSQLGHVGAYNRTLYCLSKFGLEGLTKSLALDLAKYGIRAITVAPTKIAAESEYKRTPARLKLIRNKIPLNKFSTKEQTASIVYFATTDVASSITGTSIVTDGGWTAGK
jgi:NAD(P)-dependent dehydrogenase (short-subunit alcohol dehydrogenase family)